MIEQFDYFDVEISVKTNDPAYAEHVWRWVLALQLGEAQRPAAKFPPPGGGGEGVGVTFGRSD